MAPKLKVKKPKDTHPKTVDGPTRSYPNHPDAPGGPDKPVKRGTFKAAPASVKDRRPKGGPAPAQGRTLKTTKKGKTGVPAVHPTPPDKRPAGGPAPGQPGAGAYVMPHAPMPGAGTAPIAPGAPGAPGAPAAPPAAPDPYAGLPPELAAALRSEDAQNAATSQSLQSSSDLAVQNAQNEAPTISNQVAGLAQLAGLGPQAGNTLAPNALGGTASALPGIRSQQDQQAILSQAAGIQNTTSSLPDYLRASGLANVSGFNAAAAAARSKEMGAFAQTDLTQQGENAREQDTQTQENARNAATNAATGARAAQSARTQVRGQNLGLWRAVLTASVASGDKKLELLARKQIAAGGQAAAGVRADKANATRLTVAQLQTKARAAAAAVKAGQQTPKGTIGPVPGTKKPTTKGVYWFRGTDAKGNAAWYGIRQNGKGSAASKPISVSQQNAVGDQFNQVWNGKPAAKGVAAQPGISALLHPADPITGQAYPAGDPRGTVTPEMKLKARREIMNFVTQYEKQFPGIDGLQTILDSVGTIDQDAKKIAVDFLHAHGFTQVK